MSSPKLSLNHPRVLAKLSFAFAFAAVFTFLVLRLPQETQAASLENFRPGNIISDYTMSNVNTMSVADIQNFLNERAASNNACGDTATYRVDWYPNLHYHIENGHFVCLAEERFAVSGSNYGDLLAPGEASQSAAEIIYEVAHEYTINPQVLLVLLQKEQGLLTDSWPNHIQYRAATGFGCPDTAPCDAQYYGFKNQLKLAADLFRTVLDGGWTNYPLGENYIYYNPNRDCGGSVVNIENLATSSLYRYTPYQPNAAALAAGYGTVTCGAYGNRNFYLYFLDYFGYDPTITVATNANLPSGEYEILSTISNELRLTSYNEAISNASGFQTWEIEAGDGFYYIAYNNLYLTANPGNSIKLSAKTGDNDQKWIIHDNSDSTYSIYSKPYGTVLDVDDGSSVNGTRVKLYTRTGKDNTAQKWTINKIETEAVDYSGLYYIFSAGSTKAIDIYAGDIANNTNVQVYQQSFGNKAQEWQITKSTHGNYYTIINPTSGKALDVENNRISNNANVQIYEYNDSCAQRWQIHQRDDGTFLIVNACHLSEVLDVQDFKTNVQIYEYAKDNPAQKWQLKKLEEVTSVPEPESIEEETEESEPETPSAEIVSVSSRDDYSGKYYIISAIDKKALDAYGGSTANGTNIWIYPRSEGNLAQIWTIEKYDNHYLIKNSYSGKVLDVAGGLIRNNSNIWIYAQNNTCAQLWDILPNSSGTVTIVNACNNHETLDVQDFKTNVQIYQRSDNNTAQQWALVEVE